MNPTLAQVIESSRIITANGTTKPLDNFHVSEQEGNFLGSLIRDVKPDIAIEVGYAYGISSLYIGEALQEVGAKKHIIIDPFRTTRISGPEPDLPILNVPVTPVSLSSSTSRLTWRCRN